MNTAILIKKALKHAELFMEDHGLKKIYQNKAIDSTNVMADARTGSVQIEQLYRKSIKIKKDIYIVSAELNLTISELDTETTPQFVYSCEPSLARLIDDGEFESETFLAHNFGDNTDFSVVCRFINNLPKLKVKSIEELKY